VSRPHVDAVRQNYALGQADEHRLVVAYLRRLAAAADGSERAILTRVAEAVAGYEHRADDIPF
jgi:hypothetical protein